MGPQRPKDGPGPFSSERPGPSAAREPMRVVWDRIERTLTSYPPERRRRLAIKVVFWSVVLGAANVALYAFGIIDQTALILVTLVLSWLAITITAADLVASTDIRAEGDGD